MSKNPFKSSRKEDAKLRAKIEQWGKVKFKPTISNKYDHSSKKKSHNYDNICNAYGEKKLENATPWKYFKDEMLLKEREEQQRSKQLEMDNQTAQQFLKQREVNYRRMLIQKKKEESTQWEDFEDDTSKQKQRNPKQKANKLKHDVTGTLAATRMYNVRSHKRQQRELKENFNSKNLNYEQNDKLRRLLTKCNVEHNGSTFEQMVNDAVHQKKKKERKMKKMDTEVI